MQTIAIMNNKGGVGKTVTAINLADILVADYKQRVVLVDCDGQANLTRFFLPGADKLELTTTADVLRGDCEPLWSDNLVPIRPGLDLLPSSSDLYELDLQAIKDGVSAPERLRHFAEAAAADSEVDWMIFDCPPGYTLASVAALLSVREVMIPALADKFSLDGVFAVTEKSFADGGWTVTLVPEVSAMKRLFTSIEVSGAALPTNAVMKTGDGGCCTIRFRELPNER